MGGDSLDFEPDELEGFVEEYMALDQKTQRPKGIYSILPGSREGQYQYTLEYFLDPQRPHGFDYTLLKTFFECVEFHEFNLAGQHIEIDDEVGIADNSSNGRIDLVIAGGSALAAHPTWAVFIELKVGAEEGTGQTTKYAEADAWNFNWFNSDELAVEQLDETKYLYVKREDADAHDDETDTFESVDWSEIVEGFETEIQDDIFEYPNRSVIQFTDFIQSVKEAESMDSGINEAELDERLTLYFKYKELIQQVEQANSQFESDFEDLSTYLRDNWETELFKKYDFEESGWKTSPSSNIKWQGILPAYWDQDPLNQSSTIELYFRHSPTTEALRNRRLAFRLRLPPMRDVHTEERHEGRSFNEIFTDKCTSEYEDRIVDSLDSVGVEEFRLGSASALVIKDYQLDKHNLVESYFDQLDQAVYEFCSDGSEFLQIINEVFEDTYELVFDEEPVGEFPGPLPERD